jgi:hypothetical protein
VQSIPGWMLSESGDMGALTSYLQREFGRLCPHEWTCRYESRLLPPELEELLGYAPRVDVLLERKDGEQQLWIEFEVSRADPVANHAKYATAHLFRPQPQGASFITMVSPHVARGRRNLAANMIVLMRQMEISAFQTPLFPQIAPAEIKRLNHLDLGSLAGERLPVEPEIERALAISQPQFTVSSHRIHYAGDLLEVMLNLYRWNEDIGTPEGAKLWGRRTITYFVFDARSGGFAPSKFCAYVPVAEHVVRRTEPAVAAIRPAMTMELYSTLDATERTFDGARAREHLTKRLAMTPKPLRELPELLHRFSLWHGRHSEAIALHPAGPVILFPPPWFAGAG